MSLSFLETYSNNFKQLIQGKKLESIATVLYLTCYMIQRLGQFT